MSAALKEEINFWPGYVDALINVLLNLLFLVGIFTVGLVALNSEALLAKKKAADKEVQAALQGSHGEARRRKAQNLLASLSDDATVPPTTQAVTAAEASEQKTHRVREFRIQREFVPATPQGHLSTTDLTQNIARTQKMLEKELSESGGRKLLGLYVFGMNEYQLPASATLPWKGAMDEGDLLLLILADPKNPRMSNEAFARLVAVRELLIRGGIPLARIQLRMMPPVDGVVHAAQLERSVLVLQK